MTWNWTQRIGHEKYITYADSESQTFTCYTRLSAVFKLLHILQFFHVKVSKHHKSFKLNRLPRTDSLYSTMIANVLMKFRWDQMKATEGGGGVDSRSILKFSAKNGPVLTKVLNCHIYFLILPDRKKSGGMETFENLDIRNFEKCTEWPQIELKRIWHEEYSTYGAPDTSSPKFSHYDQPFPDIAHFRIFPLTPILKSQSVTHFYDLKFIKIKIYNFSFRYDCLDGIKTLEEK